MVVCVCIHVVAPSKVVDFSFFSVCIVNRVLIEATILY